MSRQLKLCTLGQRRLRLLLLVLIATTVLVVLLTLTLETSTLVSDMMIPVLGLQKELSHFRRNRSLRRYLDNIDVLIEPSSVPCSEETQLLVLVTSSPSRVSQRDAIRRTWGKYFHTYFVMGVDGSRDNGQLIDNYVEAKEYSDMIVFDFKDHYQNLTIKTGLMLKWTLDRCPQASFLYKVDDDVLVNPWMLEAVLRENRDAKLIGYVNINARLHRNEASKWYTPRWLCEDDVIPQYLSGPSYLIKGDYIPDILKAAYEVPLHNLEDVYFTHHVAQKALGYELTHDERLSPFRIQPSWFPINCVIPACAYWTTAAMHSFTPEEILKYYTYIKHFGQKYDSNNDTSMCSFYKMFVKPFVLML